MRRILSVFVVVALMLSASACGADAEPEPTPTAIQLTTSNFDEYLNYRITVTDDGYSSKDGVVYRNAKITFEIYPIASGSFENVEIDVALNHFTTGWYAAEYGGGIKEDFDKFIRTDFVIPTSGNYSETHTISSLAIVNYDAPTAKVWFYSVSGTFIPAA